MSPTSLDSLANSVAVRLVNSRYGQPYHINLEVTTKCNLNCRQCGKSRMPVHSRDSDMSFDLFRSIVDDLGYPTKHVNLIGLGEPLMNVQVFHMIEYIKKKGFEVSITDNFTLLDEKVSQSLIDLGLDYLYASFDSVSKVEFEKIRTGASFDRVLENIKHFVEIRLRNKAKKPLIYFKSTISKENYSEIPKIVKLAEDLGLDGVDFSKQISQDKGYFNDPAFHLDPEILPKTDLEIVPCEMGDYPCQGLIGCFVTFDGKVMPCDHVIQILQRDEFSSFQVGDLSSDAISKVWRSAHHRGIRKGLASGKFLPFCNKCPAYR